MSILILPQRFKHQPQYAAPLDRGGPFYRHIVFAYSAGRGLQDGKHTGVIGSSVGTITHRYGSSGRYITPADGSSYVQVPSVDDYNVVGNITVIARVRLGSVGTQQAIAIKSASSGGIDTPFGFLIESDGSVALNRSNNAGGASFRVWSSSAKLAAGQTAVIAATQPTDISIPPKFYIDGSFDTGAASSLYGGAAAGAAGSTTSPIQLGNRTDFASRFFGNIFDVIIFNDVFSPHAIDGLSRDLDQIWRAPPRKIWLGSATTNYTLPADSGSFALTGTTANLEYHRLLAATQGSFAVTGTAATLRRDYALPAASASFALSGTDAELRLDRVLQAGSASSQIAGTDASLEYNRVLPAESASFQIVGTDATFIHDAPGSYTLSAESASYGISAQPAALKYNRCLSADTASFAFTGSAASLRYARAVIAEAAVFALIGTDATFIRTGGPEPIVSTVERTAVFRAAVDRAATFQRNKQVNVRFN